MTVPTISNLPTVPATSDPNFETEAPALFNHIKNTFVSEMNSAISFINSSTFDATVEFKNADFTAARNFLYMIDTSSAGVSVTLPANPSTGDQLLLMDQKRNFGTNNLTIVRNGQNINGAASNVVSKSTGALIRCIFQASYGWTVDLYEGEWESGTNAGDLVYNGGNVGIGTSSPAAGTLLHVQGVIGTTNGTAAAPTHSFYGDQDNGMYRSAVNELSFSTAGTQRLTIDSSGKVGIRDSSPDSTLDIYAPASTAGFMLSYNDAAPVATTAFQVNAETNDDSRNIAQFASLNEGVRMTIRADGNVGIGTSSPGAKLHATGDIVAQNATNPTVSANDNGTLGASDKSVYMRYDTVNDVGVLGSFHNGTGAKNLVLNQLGGNVGIGTSAPDSNLAVCQPGSVAAGRGGQINFHGPVNATDTTAFAYIKGYKQNATNDHTGGFLSLGTRADGQSNPTEKIVVDEVGNMKINSGNLIIGTAGKGIDFSATSGTGTSELLDDYEEGTFTPTVATQGDYGGTWTDNSSTGIYTKIGNIVTINLKLNSSTNINFSSQTKYIIFTGLPFSTASNSYASAAVASGSVATYGLAGTALLGHSSTNIYMYGFNSTASINNLRLTISYRVS